MNTVGASLAAQQACEQLERVIFPFWLDRGIDEDQGGFFTCFDNRGRQLVSTDKFTWSQARFVWMLARAARLADQGLLDLDAEALGATAVQGASFLVEHAVRPDGTCVFLLDRSGTPKLGLNGEVRSVYADCLVAMALFELARHTLHGRWLDIAAPIVDRAAADIADGVAPTPPYEVPPGVSPFGPRVILANARLDQAGALTELGIADDRSRSALTDACLVMFAHRDGDGTFAEMIPSAPSNEDTLMVRHRVPGHALECLWIAMTADDFVGELSDASVILASLRALCASAWDTQHDGLLRYVDVSGPIEPTGTSDGSGYELLVRRTWDTKLWWVHTEAAYAAALAAQRYDDVVAWQWFERIWSYALRTFPGRGDGEEWVQIRDRYGKPLDQVVGLPVKDPFHIARNLMQILELFGPRL